jgi:hypothetical protein
LSVFPPGDFAGTIIILAQRRRKCNEATKERGDPLVAGVKTPVLHFSFLRVFALSRFRDDSTETTLHAARVWLVADWEPPKSVNGGNRERAKTQKTENGDEFRTQLRPS